MSEFKDYTQDDLVNRLHVDKVHWWPVDANGNVNWDTTGSYEVSRVAEARQGIDDGRIKLVDWNGLVMCGHVCFSYHHQTAPPFVKGTQPGVNHPVDLGEGMGEAPVVDTVVDASPYEKAKAAMQGIDLSKVTKSLPVLQPLSAPTIELGDSQDIFDQSGWSNPRGWPQTTVEEAGNVADRAIYIAKLWSGWLSNRTGLTVVLSGEDVAMLRLLENVGISSLSTDDTLLNATKMIVDAVAALPEGERNR